MAAVTLTVLFAVSVGATYGLPAAHAGGLDFFTGYEKTLVIESVEVQPAGGDNDSYFLVYGRELGTNDLTIVELQINILSLGGNLVEGFDGDLNREFLKYVVEHNIGNTISFECNGAENMGYAEEYPQCFRINNIIGEPTGDSRAGGSNAAVEKLLAVNMEQLKVIQQLVAQLG